MRQQTFVVFDEYVRGSQTPVYTSCVFDPWLGAFEQTAIQVEAHSIKSNGTLTVQLQVSGDGEYWTSKRATPEINAALLTGQFRILVGYDYGDLPSMPFVRYRIAHTGTDLHVKVHVTLRDHAGKTPLPLMRDRPGLKVKVTGPTKDIQKQWPRLEAPAPPPVEGLADLSAVHSGSFSGLDIDMGQKKPIADG